MKSAKSSSARTVLFFVLTGVLAGTTLSTLAGCSHSQQEAVAPNPPEPPTPVATAVPSPKIVTKSGLTQDDVNFLNWIMAAEKQCQDSHDRRLFTEEEKGTQIQAVMDEYAAVAKSVRSHPAPPDCRPLAKAYADYLQVAAKEFGAGFHPGSPAEKAGLELRNKVAAFQAKHPDSPVDLSPLKGFFHGKGSETIVKIG